MASRRKTVMTTVLCGLAETICHSARVDGENLWVSSDDLEAATGWVLKPEGLCREAVCVARAPPRTAQLVRDDAINVAGFWRHLGHPVVHNAAAKVWVLGSSAIDRTSALQSLQAPDFALPDLTGQVVDLAQQRGKKVLLATWASW
jgi:hypothetical protein